MENDRSKAVETHHMNRNHQFGHQVSPKFIHIYFIISKASNFGFSMDVFFLDYFAGRVLNLTRKNHLEGYCNRW